jgi:hypothetical protein
MADKPNNPLGMIRDSYAGDSFILPETLCTDERRSWFRRCKEIMGFLTITELSLKECRNRYEQLLVQKKLQPDTPLKLGFSDGRSAIMPVNKFLNGCNDGVEFLCRQVFVMLYGAWETYLFELLEKSFPQVGISENVLEESLRIMMKRNWDGKFCKMGNLFGVEYRVGDVIQHFRMFELNYEDTMIKNPLIFLDELAQIRHKIIHASSILDNGKQIFINAKILPAFFSFFVLLTEYVDNLFSKKFNYVQSKINPAEA